MKKIKVDETTPCFRDININHVICRTARRAAYFNGLPEMPVKNITITDLEVNNAKEGIESTTLTALSCRTSTSSRRERPSAHVTLQT